MVSTVGYTAFLAGPPLLGFMGDHYGVLRALLLVGAVSVLALLVVPAARPARPERSAVTSVVLLDIDGTLVDYRTDLPASAAAAVHCPGRRRHRVYLCTGRSRAEIYPELWQLGVDGLIGVMAAMSSSGEVIFHQVMDETVVAEAIDWMSGDGLGYYLECNSGLFDAPACRSGRRRPINGRGPRASSSCVRSSRHDLPAVGAVTRV